jgi:WD40 repeat protein
MLVARAGVSVADAATGAAVAHLPPPPGARFIGGAGFVDATHVRVLADGSLFTWEIGAGAASRLAGPPFVPATAAAFSPDDPLIAEGLDDGDIALWDLAASPPVRRLAGHASSVTAVAFTRDGGALVSAARDGTARVWSAEAGRELRTLAGHRGAVLSLSLSPDGKVVATGSADRTIRLWNLETGEELRRLDVPTAVAAVTFSAEGARLATGGEDGVIRVFDAATGAALHELETRAPISSLAFAGASEVVSRSRARSGDKLLRWDLASGAKLPNPCAWGLELTPSQDGRTLAITGCANALEIAVLDAATWKPLPAWTPLGTFRTASSFPGALALSHAGDALLQTSFHGLSVYRAGEARERLVLRLAPSVSGGMAATPDGYFDLFGRDGDTFRRLSRCASSQWSLPFEVCEERFLVPGLFAKVMDGDESFREP